MATYLLDTNIIIDALNAKRDRNTSLLELVEQGHTLACCPFAAQLGGRWERDYALKGKTFSIADMIIAAVALHHQLTLVIDNIKDFPMEGLSLHSSPGRR